MSSLPTGTVTFLFTDIERSTRLLQEVGDARAVDILEEHQRILRAAFETFGGRELQASGDGFLVAFRSARDALRAAVAGQRAVAAHRWPDDVQVRIRMGLNTGEPAVAPGGYVGLDVHRAHRICSAGWGGQILTSESTRWLIEHDLPGDVSLRDLGLHRLRDLQAPEHLYQVVAQDLQVDFPPLKSPGSLPNNLPHQLTSFVGREREMDEVKRLIASARLVTLTGSGGCGKTRLAIQVAADALDTFADGSWLVELAALVDPALVPQRVASTLHVREQPGRPLTAILCDYLQDRHLLLILDNCEHITGACASLADLLIRACPRVHILATSQESLNVGEITWWVPPFPLPDLARLPPLERLAQNEAVQLFCERAAAVLPAFRLTEQNAAWVAYVCHQLDGIPLAIELAAARVKVLPIEQIAARLEDRFRLLTGGMRTVLTRHQTLRATMDWSYNLSPERERQLLRRLSAFAGGFTLEAAETIGAGGGIDTADILELLTQLVDRSLVLADTKGPVARYRLLETVRQYAREKLSEIGEDGAVRATHRDWFLDLATRAEPMLIGSEESWLDRLETEHDNLRAALDTSLRLGPPEAGLRLAAALRQFWQVRGYWTEGRQWLEVLLAATTGPPPEVRARALAAAGQLAQHQGDYERAKALSGESLDLYRSLRDTQGMASALNVLGNVTMEQGAFRAARRLHEESLACGRQAGDRHLVASSLVNLANIADHEGDFTRAAALAEESLAVFREGGYKRGIAAALHMLGVVAGDQGEFVAARKRYEESLALRRELGDRRGIAASLSSLGRTARQQADYVSARAYYDEGLTIRRELGDKRGIAAALYDLGIVASRQNGHSRAAALLSESLAMRRTQGNLGGVAECLEGLARVASNPERTACLLGGAEALRETMGAPLPPAERHEYEQAVLAARRALGESAFTSAWNLGGSMPMDELIQYAVPPATRTRLPEG